MSTRNPAAASRRRPGGFASTREIAVATPWPGKDSSPLRSLLLAEAWQRASGPALAAVTLPGDLRRGVLIIEILDTAWERDLRRLEVEILEALNAELGAGGIGGGESVKALDFHVRPGSTLHPARRAPLPVAEGRRAGAPLSGDLNRRLAEVTERYLRPRS